MSAKLIVSIAIIAYISVQVLAYPKKNAVKAPVDDDEEGGDNLGSIALPGIQLGSQQESQSSQEHSSGKKGAASQQHQQGQQQLAASIGGKHYLLQQQTALGQQLARLGRKSAIQQLVDVQKQAVANGNQEKSSKTASNDEVKDDKDDATSEESKTEDSKDD